jgi:hypothetical protein
MIISILATVAFIAALTIPSAIVMWWVMDTGVPRFGFVLTAIVCSLAGSGLAFLIGIGIGLLKLVGG